MRKEMARILLNYLENFEEINYKKEILRELLERI